MEFTTEELAATNAALIEYRASLQAMDPMQQSAEELGRLTLLKQNTGTALQKVQNELRRQAGTYR